MSEWKTVRLGDVCEIAAGQGAPQGDSNYCNDGTPFVKAGNLIKLIEGKHENQIQKVSEEVAKSHKLKKYSAGSILFAKSGMSCMKGYVYQLKNDSYVVSHLAIVKPKEDSSDYIEYCLRHIKPNTLVKDEAYPSISLQDISNLQIPLPPLEKQKHIANVLDKCTILIAKYKQMLAKYDTLIKSRFIEMFGNIQKYNKEPFKNCSLFIDYRGHTPEVTEQGSIRMVNAKSVGKGFFKYVNEYVTEEIYDSWMHRGFPKPNDVLFVTEGHTFGNTCQVPANMNKFALGQRVITIRGNENKLNNFFLNAYMQTDDFYKDINKYKTGGTAQGIRSKDLLKVEIPLPPLMLQNNFASFVQQIDKSKFEYTYTGVAA